MHCDTWVRISVSPVEGKLVARAPGLDVGQQLRVKRVATDMRRGFIDDVLADRGAAASGPSTSPPAY